VHWRKLATSIHNLTQLLERAEHVMENVHPIHLANADDVEIIVATHGRSS